MRSSKADPAFETSTERKYNVAKLVAPGRDVPFPPWQGMQYFASMFSGDADLRYISNDRYGSRKWTTARDVLEQHRQQG